MTFVHSEYKNQIGTIIMNHPEKRNALSSGMIEEIIESLNHFKKEKARVVILRAEPGSKVWSAGHDVKELPLSGRDPLAYTDPLRVVVREVNNFPAPIIAMIEGGVWGGACELVLACDLRVASAGATFAITPTKLGVPYNATGILTCLTVVSMATLKEMFFTAQPISAARAEKLGMINHRIAPDELETFTYDMAEGICNNAPLSIQFIKEQLRILSGAKNLTPETFERIQSLRKVVYDSQDYREGISAFLEKRKSVFTGK